MKPRFMWLSLVSILVVSLIFSTQYIHSSPDILVIEGKVYDYSTRAPIENALVIYFIVFHDSEEHVGFPIEYAYTDSSGHYKIELNDVEKQLGSNAEYTLDQIRDAWFMLVAYKDGYLRNYVVYNPYKPIYHKWQLGENKRIYNIPMYSSYPVKEVSYGNIKARYHYGYMKEAAEMLAQITDHYVKLLEEKLGIDLVNDEIVIEFDMGNYSKVAGWAEFGVTEPNKVIVNWYPWITDPKNMGFRLLIVHELTHLFQKRLNNKGMIIRLSGPWFTEGQAVAVSKAILYEEGIGGVSFQEQATDPIESLPSSYNEYFKVVGENYPKWGKLFSKIVVEYKKDGEGEWDFIKRFMQYFDNFAKDGSICENYAKSCRLSDYETILLLSYTACINLTDTFIGEYNFPQEILLPQKNAYLKFLAARTYLSEMSTSDPHYPTFKMYFENGVEKYATYSYGEAEQEFSKALQLVGWKGSITDPIMLKCLIIKVHVNLQLTLSKDPSKYIIYVDGRGINPKKPIDLPPGKHKFEVFFKKSKVLEKYIILDEETNRVNLRIVEHVLKVNLGENVAKVYVYRDNVLVEMVEDARGIIEFILPKGEYTITAVLGEARKSMRVSLNKDTEVNVGSSESVAREGTLILSIVDQHGRALKANVEVDGREYNVEGKLSIKLPLGKHRVVVEVSRVIVYDKTIVLEEKQTTVDVVVKHYILRVKVSQKPFKLAPTCTLFIYEIHSGEEPIQVVGIVDERSLYLPEGIYTVRVQCGGREAIKSVELKGDVVLGFEVSVIGEEYYILALAAAIVLLTILIVAARRKGQKH